MGYLLARHRNRSPFLTLRFHSREMTSSVVQEILASSVVLANESAALVRSIFKNGELGVIDKGGLKNYQTEADRAVQRLIITTLRAKFPDVNIIGEEDGDDGSDGAEKCKVYEAQDGEVLGKTMPVDLASAKANDVTIWIDPLDGTMEFIDRLLHHVTILIGVAVGDKSHYQKTRKLFARLDPTHRQLLTPVLKQCS